MNLLREIEEDMAKQLRQEIDNAILNDLNMHYYSHLYRITLDDWPVIDVSNMIQHLRSTQDYGAIVDERLFSYQIQF